MVQLKLIVGANRSITEIEYNIFEEYVNEKVQSGEIIRFSMSLEKGCKTTSKYHIQCIFEFNDELFDQRDWCKKAKERMKFNSVLMKSRKSCCFMKLDPGQDFMLIACGYNIKDPNKKKFSSYGISDEEFEEYSRKYFKLVEAKDNKNKMLFLGNVLQKSVRYARENKINEFPKVLVEMFKDGYNFSNVIGKLPDDLETHFDYKMGKREIDEFEFMEILRKKA